jgi:hypothetical protein
MWQAELGATKAGRQAQVAATQLIINLFVGEACVERNIVLLHGHHKVANNICSRVRARQRIKCGGGRSAHVKEYNLQARSEPTYATGICKLSLRVGDSRRLTVHVHKSSAKCHILLLNLNLHLPSTTFITFQ